MSDAFEELKRRCNGAGLRYEAEYDQGEYLTLHYPRGRGTADVWVAFDEEAQQLLRQPFEMYRAIEGFQATWSSEQGVIECNLLWPSWHMTRPDARVLHQSGLEHVLRQLGVDISLQQKAFTPDQRVEFATNTGLSISIGPCSDMHGILLYPMDFMDFNYNQDPWRTLTLRIEGATVGRHDDAVELLKRVADSTLFQLDISRGLHLTLERSSDLHRGSAPLHNVSPEANSVGEIRYGYDDRPMSLYWHGKTVEDMPLLRFLAYYQVLEFYFPYYSEIAAAETLQKSILNEPGFDPTKPVFDPEKPAYDPTETSDISRLLKANKFNFRGRGFGTEVEQLEDTIRRCVSADDLKSFFSDDRIEFYTSKKASEIAKESIPLGKKSGDIRRATAKRIYAIRNRIVHTKGGLSEKRPLFPFDSEVKYLSHDIDLVEFLARMVLIESSRPLEV